MSVKSAHSPSVNPVLPFEEKKSSLFFVLADYFGFPVLIPYHTHVGTYVIHFYISRGSYF